MELDESLIIELINLLKSRSNSIETTCLNLEQDSYYKQGIYEFIGLSKCPDFNLAKTNFNQSTSINAKLALKIMEYLETPADNNSLHNILIYLQKYDVKDDFLQHLYD